jgi:1-acyl-sn-glycerol-3-phosphate acyltransferase
MHLAMTHHTPIVPIGVVGCEETMPSLTNISPLAKALGLPYFPLAFPLPLPARVILNFGKPILFEDDVHREEEIAERVDKVKSAIRGLIEEGLAARESIY